MLFYHIIICAFVINDVLLSLFGVLLSLDGVFLSLFNVILSLWGLLFVIIQLITFFILKSAKKPPKPHTKTKAHHILLAKCSKK